MTGASGGSAERQDLVGMLEAELAQTNREILALTLELDRRVDERTAELNAAQEELQRTNSELLQITLELEERVAARTAELNEANKSLLGEIERRRQAESKLISLNAHLEAKNEELRAMTQQLWQTAKLATMGELAASIAHELNNPLATVSLRLETLTAQMTDADPRRRLTDVISGEIDRMGALVSNLLAFSRGSRQHISTLDVREEIDRSLELVAYILRRRGIPVDRHFADGLPDIHVDRQQLRQVLLNLFTNAADAMPGGGTLTIRAQPSGDGRSVVVEVCDTGVGIPAENLKKVTEPFFTTKPEGKGTGLGLSICRRIVAEHHGEMAITSEPGKGTSVRISIPVKNSVNGEHLTSKEE